MNAHPLSTQGEIDLSAPGVAAITEELRTRQLLLAAAEHTVALERTLRALHPRTLPDDQKRGFRNALQNLRNSIDTHLPAGHSPAPAPQGRHEASPGCSPG